MNNRFLMTKWFKFFLVFLINYIAISQDSKSIIEGLGTIDAFYSARGDTGYVTYLKRVKRQIQINKNFGRYENLDEINFAETLVDLYIYSLAPITFNDSVKQKIFARAEKYLQSCEKEVSKQCIELMKAIINAYIVDKELLKAYLTNEKLKSIITSEGIQDTFVYLLTLYNTARLGVYMYNEHVLTTAEQEIEKFLPHIPSPKYYPLVGLIYNAIGVGRKSIASQGNPRETIKILKKAEKFLLQSQNIDRATKKTLSVIYGNIADAYLDLMDSAVQQGNLETAHIFKDSALMYINKSFNLARETGNILTLLYDKFRLAILKMLEGDTATAHLELMQLMKEAKELGLSEEVFMPDVAETIIYSAKGIGDYEKALKTCASLLTYYDSVEVEITEVASTFMRERMRIEEEKEKALEEAARYSEGCKWKAYLSGFFTFLLFFFWALWIYRKARVRT